ncbi:MAG TPA: methyltransferase domain-containing protein [Steroidobacteraceae bacterium]|nr:methyltransferase domain-containing protein [Steroidobacteraceae bacterium]
MVNVGAGTGSYEPFGRCTAAIEPSMTMIRQRPAAAAPAVQARAARLPLRDECADIVMAILTVHHWDERARSFAELGRIARRRIVFLTWDPDWEPQAPGFWLTDDYFPALRHQDRVDFPALSEFRRAYGRIATAPVSIPHDCRDGFAAAYWRRPDALLDPAVRAATSTFAKIRGVEAGVARLRGDIESGAWSRRCGHLLAREALDLGYRLVTVDL